MLKLFGLSSVPETNSSSTSTEFPIDPAPPIISKHDSGYFERKLQGNCRNCQLVLQNADALAENKVSRKILDLEISNTSLLAVNTSLEASIRRQANKIEELKRQLNAAKSLLKKTKQEQVEQQVPADESENRDMQDLAYERVCSQILNLIDSTRNALSYTVNNDLVTEQGLLSSCNFIVLIDSHKQDTLMLQQQLLESSKLKRKSSSSPPKTYTSETVEIPSSLFGQLIEFLEEENVGSLHIGTIPSQTPPYRSHRTSSDSEYSDAALTVETYKSSRANDGTRRLVSRPSIDDMNLKVYKSPRDSRRGSATYLEQKISSTDHPRHESVAYPGNSARRGSVTYLEETQVALASRIRVSSKKRERRFAIPRVQCPDDTSSISSISSL